MVAGITPAVRRNPVLVNGAHLLPDASGAVVWPQRRLVAASDPLPEGGRVDSAATSALVKRLAGLLRRRQPAATVWLGDGLAAALAAGRLPRREAAELTRMVAGCDWTWVAESLPAGLPGTTAPELALAPLTFRAAARAAAGPGEIAGRPWPVATIRDGECALTHPCYLADGRRLLLPAFGPSASGIDALSPEVLALYRRPFQALLLLPGGRVLTRPRTALVPPRTR